MRKLIFILVFFGSLLVGKPVFATPGTIPMGLMPSPSPSVGQMMSVADKDGGVNPIGLAALNSSGHMALGSSGIDNNPIAPGAPALLSIYNQYTAAATQPAMGVVSFVDEKPSSSGFIQTSGFFISQDDSAALIASGTLRGVYGAAYHNNSTTQPRLEALFLNPGNESTGTVTNMYGVHADSTNDSTGTVTNDYGLFSQVDNTSTGTISNAYGLYVHAGSNSGTVTSAIGVSIQDIGGMSAGTSYNLDSTASTATYNAHFTGTSKNLFQGPTAIGGTITNDSASAGFVGEYVKSSVVSGSPVSLTNNTPANVTSISLTAGDWDVSGIICFTGAASATATLGSISTVTATIGILGDAAVESPTSSTAASDNCQAIPVLRESLAATTSIYLVAESTFSGTQSTYGRISARRVR